MIDGDKAIEYLKNKLINLIDQGIIKATYEESENTISFYITDITTTNRPPLTLRLSNHHENFNNRKKSKSGLPQGDDNLSIELYKPQKGYRNRVKSRVDMVYYAPPKPEVIPFSVTTIEYRPWLMYGNDVNLIYQSILNWIKSKNKNTVYIDPLVKTSRRANIETHQANITPRRYVTQAEKNFYLRYGLGDNIEPRYNIIKENINCNRNMNKKLIRLTESDLHRIVKESVNKVLNEMDYDSHERAMKQHPSLMDKVDPRTFANRARGVNAQGRPRNDSQYLMQSSAADAWNKRYERHDSVPNGFEQPYNSYGVKWVGHDDDHYRMNTKGDGYQTVRWRSKNYPGPNDMDDTETYTEYDPQTDKTLSTTYGRMKYNTVGSPGKSLYNYPKFGAYDGRPIRNQSEMPSGSEGDMVARQMATGSGKYDPNKGWQ